MSDCNGVGFCDKWEWVYSSPTWCNPVLADVAGDHAEARGGGQVANVGPDVCSHGTFVHPSAFGHEGVRGYLLFRPVCSPSCSGAVRPDAFYEVASFG